jgi:hypothetical protein
MEIGGQHALALCREPAEKSAVKGRIITKKYSLGRNLKTAQKYIYPVRADG